MQDIENIKEKELLFYLEKKQRGQLKRLGQDYGFLNSKLRQKAYAFLFEINSISIERNLSIEAPTNSIPYQKIIKSDVDRSINANVFLQGQSAEVRENMKERLNLFLLRFFSINPHYSYYQGFNSIAETFLFSFPESEALVFLESFSKLILNDYLNPKKFTESIESFYRKASSVIRRTTGVVLKQKLYY